MYHIGRQCLYLCKSSCRVRSGMRKFRWRDIAAVRVECVVCYREEWLQPTAVQVTRELTGTGLSGVRPCGGASSMTDGVPAGCVTWRRRYLPQVYACAATRHRWYRFTHGHLLPPTKNINSLLCLLLTVTHFLYLYNQLFPTNNILIIIIIIR